MAFHVSDFLNQPNTASTDTAKSIRTAVDTLKNQAVSQYANAGAKLLQDMLAGDTFTGYVNSVKDNTVMLQLIDGRTLSATLSQNTNIQPGQNITFLIEENTGNTISIRALMPNEQQAVLINKALDAAGLPLTDGNVDIVRELLNNNMPVSKDMINELFKNSLKFPQTSLNTIANLVKLEIPVTEDNIHQFEAYKNYEHSIAGEMNSLPENLTNVLSRMMQNGQAADGINFLKTVLNGMYTDYNAQQAPEEQLAQDVNITQNTQGAQSEQFVQNPMDEKTVSGPLGLTSSSVGMVLSDSDIASLSSSLSKAFGEATSFVIEQMKQGNMTVKELLSQIIELSKKATEGTNNVITSQLEMTKETLPDRLKELLGSKQVHHLLKQAVDETMKLTPLNVADEDSIKKFYRQLRGCVGTIADAANKEAAGTDLAKNVGEMKSNIDFMNDLNKNMTYFQMPVKFSESEGNGELYVFTNKKALKQGTGNLSALLHLDMEHLGPLEIYVRLAGKQVSTNFCLESEDLLDFIYAHIDQLNSRLEALGYSTKFEMKVADPETDKVDFIDDFISQGNKPMTSSQFLFDTKA